MAFTTENRNVYFKDQQNTKFLDISVIMFGIVLIGKNYGMI